MNKENSKPENQRNHKTFPTLLPQRPPIFNPRFLTDERQGNRRRIRAAGRRLAKCAFAFLCGALSFILCNAEGETLFVNGVVWTADWKQPRAEAVLVRGERIHFVGARAEATALAGDDVAVMDLKGGMLLPGFVESHIHPGMAGLLASKLQIIGTSAVAEVQAALADYAAANPDAKSLFGFGFPSALNTAVNAAGVTGPYRKDLDAIVSDRPVMLIALDAHSAWVNSKALEVAGIDKNTPDPLPGVHYYQRDKNGGPTGWLVEGAAFWPLVPLFGIGSEEDFRAAYEALLPKLSTMGVTTVFDAGIPGDGLLNNALKALAGMERDGKLPLRYRASVYIDKRDVNGEEAAQNIQQKRRAFASGLVDVHTAKIANDGTIEGETAAVLKPYAGGGRGAVLLPGEPLSALLSALFKANLDAHVHAIGDRTLRVTLDAVEAARKAAPKSDSRVAVAHAMLTAPEDLRRLKALGVSIQTTPHWAHDLSGTLSLYSRLLDAERGARVMLLKDLWEEAPLVAFGSDYPATGLPFSQISPLHGIEIGCTRRAPGATKGEPLPPANQRMTLADMLAGYTVNGARQLRMENEIGVIATGKQADFVVVERDLFQELPRRIHSVPVVLTMSAGRVVFERKRQ